MPEPNVQDRNVGNRGDVHKHLALVALAGALRRRATGPVRHVETHAFRLHAPLPDPPGQEGRAGPLPDAPVAARYLALQAPWRALGRYRCSVGLAVDVLGPSVRLALAEAHAPTRAALADALADEGLRPERLVEDARALPAALPPLPLLLHVDPFDHPGGYWPLVERLLAAWRSADQPAAVLVFAYDRAAPVHLPPAPGGLVPLGRRDDRPYALAAWATADIAADRPLAGLGWEAATPGSAPR